MSLEKIQELLNKQKLVEGMVHSQDMPRHNIVETLVHRQHLTEMEILLGKLSAREIADIIESMTIDDAKCVWGTIPALRKHDVLWELSDAIREQVTGIREPDFSDSEINAFELINGKLTRVTVTCRKDLEGLQPVWIDLICTSPAERTYVGGFFGLELPDPGDVTDLEVSNRFHVKENDDIYLHSNFLLDKYDHSRSVPVAFVLHQGILFSLRNEELPVFRLQRQRARTRPGYVTDNFDLLIDLYGADVEYSADSLEDIYKTLSKVGKQVLSEKMSDQEAASVLADIAEEEDLNGQIRSNILDTQRALGFLMQSRILSKRQVNDIKQILRNIESLNSHTAFLFDKINFLMDATIGFININQNGRVNQLTVLGVVFMPINILAGIGGMSEFSMMTEGIPWPFAYSAFIVGMALIGWGTFVGLKHVENRKIKQVSNGKGRK
ncbi:magnesium and cobalt transport protein CorA [Methylomonas koyamae]|uniref:magnesium and cobalt transport protein CorA n=1 Tax=Methylomonas koyamae TaxID=702114 RepID=UPI00112947A0|nr:magnesium and cobalt transport protein CorA [Methylomonas koyamae]TPQ27699.1 magnesium transporter CorA [Methylomonas koyamae]